MQDFKYAEPDLEIKTRTPSLENSPTHNSSKKLIMHEKLKAEVQRKIEIAKKKESDRVARMEEERAKKERQKEEKARKEQERKEEREKTKELLKTGKQGSIDLTNNKLKEMFKQKITEQYIPDQTFLDMLKEVKKTEYASRKELETKFLKELKENS